MTRATIIHDGEEWTLTDECMRCGGNMGFTDLLDNASVCDKCDDEIQEELGYDIDANALAH